MKMASLKIQTTTDVLTKYASDHSIRLTPVQKKLIEETMGHKSGMMLSSADELHLLANLCKTIKAKKTLEIGTFTGYSALTIAMALPDDGKVVALDINEDYVNIGKPYWKEAKVDHKIDLRIAPASESLDTMVANGESGTYDFAFIDADKTNYDNYYEMSLKLVRSGGIIAVDNVLWSGKVADPEANEPDTVALRNLNDKIINDDRVEVSMLVIGDGTSLVFKK